MERCRGGRGGGEYLTAMWQGGSKHHENGWMNVTYAVFFLWPIRKPAVGLKQKFIPGQRKGEENEREEERAKVAFLTEGWDEAGCLSSEKCIVQAAEAALERDGLFVRSKRNRQEGVMGGGAGAEGQAQARGRGLLEAGG